MTQHDCEYVFTNSGILIHLFLPLTERYRLQCDVFEAMWLVMKEFIERVCIYQRNVGVKDFQVSFTGPLPLQEYFELIDTHVEVSWQHRYTPEFPESVPSFCRHGAQIGGGSSGFSCNQNISGSSSAYVTACIVILA